MINKERKIYMKKVLSLILTLTMLFCLSACGGKTDTDGLYEITLCLDWTPNTNHTGFFVADALGYYEEAGIKIRIVQPPEDGAELMTASGQAQFGVSFQDTLAGIYTRQQSMKITAVAALLQHNTSGIISRKGEGAHTPAGLEGKRYSTWNGPIELKIIEELMTKEGADFNKLQLIPNIVTNEAAALKNKDTDAIWIYYGWAGISCKEQGLDFDYFEFRDIDPVFDYYTPVLIANDEFLKAEPEKARAFIEATKKGYEYAAENPEKAAEYLISGDTTGSLRGSEAFVTASQRWMSEQYIADAESWGVFDGDRWDNFYTWLYENELIESPIAKGYGYTNEYLR